MFEYDLKHEIQKKSEEISGFSVGLEFKHFDFFFFV